MAKEETSSIALYVGYVLDGNGITYQNVEIKPGNQVIIDDELLLYLVKELV
jgi:hypothetical protein